jgi:hypothetical protein
LRHSAEATGWKACSSTAATRSSSISSASPVTPKVPSHVPPGAAGDLADLLGMQGAVRLPSNLRSPAKATWSTSMFRPMPMASVATRKSTSPDW